MATPRRLLAEMCEDDERLFEKSTSFLRRAKVNNGKGKAVDVGDQALPPICAFLASRALRTARVLIDRQRAQLASYLSKPDFDRAVSALEDLLLSQGSSPFSTPSRRSRTGSTSGTPSASGTPGSKRKREDGRVESGTGTRPVSSMVVLGEVVSDTEKEEEKEEGGAAPRSSSKRRKASRASPITPTKSARSQDEQTPPLGVWRSADSLNRSSLRSRGSEASSSSPPYKRTTLPTETSARSRIRTYGKKRTTRSSASPPSSLRTTPVARGLVSPTKPSPLRQAVDLSNVDRDEHRSPTSTPRARARFSRVTADTTPTPRRNARAAASAARKDLQLRAGRVPASIDGGRPNAMDAVNDGNDIEEAPGTEEELEEDDLALTASDLGKIKPPDFSKFVSARATTASIPQRGSRPRRRYPFALVDDPLVEPESGALQRRMRKALAVLMDEKTGCLGSSSGLAVGDGT